MKVLVTMAILLAAPEHKVKDPGPPLIRSTASGNWSDPSDLGRGKGPRRGARVQVRTGHVVTFDTKTERRSARSTSRGRSASTPIATPGSTSG